MLPLFLLLTALGTGAPGAEPVTTDALARTSLPESVTGTVRGRVTVEERPARRRARTYSGGAAPAQAQQPVPRVVWIRGTIDGHPATGGRMPDMAQQDTAFAPSFLSVPVGGTVNFPNRDAFFHNVFSYSSGARFDLGAYARGETKEVVFDEAGMVTVFCEVHDRMRSAILVTANPFHTTASSDGTFELVGVPAGRHTIVAWDADRGMREVEVDVRDGQITDIEIVIG